MTIPAALIPQMQRTFSATSSDTAGYLAEGSREMVRGNDDQSPVNPAFWSSATGP
jgi:hypothetical protein